MQMSMMPKMTTAERRQTMHELRSNNDRRTRPNNVTFNLTDYGDTPGSPA